MASSYSSNTPKPRHARWLRFLVPILNSDATELLTSVWRLGRSLLRAQTHEGMYELLEHEIILELRDPKGKTAIHCRRQKVRFLQDNIIAFQDQAWGDGNIFADYKCSPGIPVDQYREGNITRVLISLRGSHNRGDEEQFSFERTIEDGFPEIVEILQTDVIVRTHLLSVSIIFPVKRLPQSVKLIERNTTKGIYLGENEMTKLPDGRLKVTWETRKPRLFESYLLRWEW
jgi:hypothetical protein